MNIESQAVEIGIVYEDHNEGDFFRVIGKAEDGAWEIETSASPDGPWIDGAWYSDDALRESIAEGSGVTRWKP